MQKPTVYVTVTIERQNSYLTVSKRIHVVACAKISGDEIGQEITYLIYSGSINHMNGHRIFTIGWIPKTEHRLAKETVRIQSHYLEEYDR